MKTWLQTHASVTQAEWRARLPDAGMRPKQPQQKAVAELGLRATFTKTQGVGSRQAGFTLVEVMVALAICAIALTAGMKAMQALTHNAERQGNAVLGNLCADNALSELRITGRYPDVGDNTIACPQAGRDFEVRMTVRPTANPSFRRVDAQVFTESVPVLRVSTIVGRY